MKYLSLLVFISIGFSQLFIEDNQIHHNFKKSSHGSNDEQFSLIEWGNRMLEYLYFKKQPIILKKNDNIILINPTEKVKIITNDGDIVIGKYLFKTSSKKQIVVKGKMNNSWYIPININYKILHDDIDKISIGTGNKSIKYGITLATSEALTSFLVFILSKDELQLSALVFGVFGTPYGLLIGLNEGLSIPAEFKDPISIGVNEWKIISENDQ